MKKLLVLLAVAAAGWSLAAQDYVPTVNWPYLNPDFYEGEMLLSGGKRSEGKFNVHLGHGTLHFVENGMINEASITELLSVTIGDGEYRNVDGKMMKVLAVSEHGAVMEESLADYSAVVRNDGAYGGALNNAAKGFSYDENYGNYGYLITNDYADLLSQKDYGEALPVNVHRYLVIKGTPVLAVRKNVAALDGIDKKAFADFLKAEKINWKEPQDLLKVVSFVAETASW